MEANQTLDARGLNCPLPDPAHQEDAERHAVRRHLEGGVDRPRLAQGHGRLLRPDRQHAAVASAQTGGDFEFFIRKA